MELKVTRYELADNGVATVWLHRPDRGNSWTSRMHTEFRWIMGTLEPDPRVRVVVVTGSGKAFCVGADSQALKGQAESGIYNPSVQEEALNPGYGVRPEFDADMAWQLGYRVPIIAAVNGACAGIGLAVVAFCDIRFGVEGAKITTAAPKLGLPAEYGLSWMLPRLIGSSHAADMLYSGRVVLAEELATMGFFNKVLPRAEFDDFVAAYAAMMASMSPTAVQMAKRQMQHDILSNNPAESVETSKAEITRMMKLPEYREGVQALLEKRPPKF